MSCLFVGDGYTLDGTIKARPGIHPELAFSYRPAVPQAVHAYLVAIGKGDEQGFEARLAFVQKHLAGWEAKNRKGEAVPVSATALRGLRYQVLSDMADVIAGYAAGKEGEETEVERDEKNSSPAG